VGQEILRLSAAVVAEHSAVAKKLPTLRGFPSALADIEQQLARLVPKDFLLATPFERLTHLPRYLKAISARMDKCRADPARDTVWAREVAMVEQPFWRWASQNRGGWSDAATEFRWMCEELRVATFAQELKTPLPMSVKRLQKAWVNLQNDA
jgi:ATP-dependent helicase HrpA